MNPMKNALVRLQTANRRLLHTSRNLAVMHEPDRRSGYPRISDYKEEDLNPFQRIYKGFFQFVEESKKFAEEFKNHLYADPTIVIYPHEVDVQWKFNGDPQFLEKWVVTCDSDYNEGWSKAALTLSPTGSGIFSGHISTQVPKDGKQDRAGFCNLRTVQLRGPFKIDRCLPWFVYNYLILRVRGDGRSYMINIHLKNEFDIMWTDLHNFPLYTRGGPYWQYVRIPFSKFYMSNRGRVQDLQSPVRLWEVHGISITAAGIPGTFQLEIDYIGVQKDYKHTEEFAYEMYKPPHPYYI